MSNMTTVHTSGYRIWRDRLAFGVVTHAQARQFANAIYPLTIGAPSRGHRTSITPAEAHMLVDQLLRNPPRVAPSDAARGLEWLASMGPRLGIVRPATATRPGTMDYIGRDTVWQWVGVMVHDDCETPRGRVVHAGPIYRITRVQGVYAGRWLEYAPIPWQTGWVNQAMGEQVLRQWWVEGVDSNPYASDERPGLMAEEERVGCRASVQSVKQGALRPSSSTQKGAATS